MVAVELSRALEVAEQVVGLDHQPAVVAPPVGVADLHGELRQLVERALPRALRHPARFGNRLAERRNQRRDQLVRAFLGRLREVLLDVEPPDGVAEERGHETDAAFPVRPRQLLTAEHAPEELEARVGEGLREVRRA